HEVYGDGDLTSDLVFIYRRVDAGRFFHIGSGENRWSICNIENLLDAMEVVIDRGHHGPLLVADSRPYSWKEMAAAVARILGRSERFIHVPRGLAMTVARVNGALPRPAFLPSAFSTAHVAYRTSEAIYDCSR